MNKNPSSKAGSHSGSQEVPHLGTKRIISVLIRAFHVPILSQVNPNHILIPFILKMHFNINP
jgi:hypothetical protein